MPGFRLATLIKVVGIAGFLVAGLRPIPVQAKTVLSHAFDIGEEADFWFQWKDLTENQRNDRSEDLLQWMRWLELMGDSVVVTTNDIRLGALDVLLPDPSKPLKSEILALDHVVGLINTAGLKLILELRPTYGKNLDGPVPENMAEFFERIASLVERYDGDTNFGVALPVGQHKPFPFPDINGSWVINVADWDASSPEEKQAFADSHIISGYTLAAHADLKTIGDHVPWIHELAQTIHDANPNARIYLGPFPVDKLDKTTINTLLLDSENQPVTAIHGILTDTSLIIDDLGGEDVSSQVKSVRNLLNSMGGGHTLVLTGHHVPATTYESDESWTRSCPGSVLCSEDIQAQILAKTAIRLLDQGISPGLAAPLVPEEFYPGPLVSMNTWDSASPKLHLAGLTMSRLQQLLRETGHILEQSGPSLQKVFIGRLGADDIDQAHILFYDWYRDMPAGQAFGGIMKTVHLTPPVDAKVAYIYELGVGLESAQESYPDNVLWSDPEVVELKSDTLDIALEDQIIVIQYSAEVATPDDTGTGSDVPDSHTTDIAVDTGSSSGGGGGCSQGRNHRGGLLLCLIVSLACLTRNRRRGVSSHPSA
ncbi:MAG: hypothetical protein CMH54_04115 [Myxococcales bacterium]|nr:hypothetical protein [Myxococcales bacterium]|tara:strand:+ start:403 stop:2187 length:1785 start_codon:yes stop_codon:yes gene_type:complete